MVWWLWILFGFALLAAEMMTPGGFYVAFFGVAALLVGLLANLGVLGSTAAQWLLFSVLSVGSLLLFRRRVLALFSADAPGRDAIDTLRNEIAVLTTDLPPGAVGKAELRGTGWTVRNGGDAGLVAGQRCRVIRTDGLTLLVQAE
ncbi:MAG: NfeD family protein [Candidatus Binatia bacterium]